MRRSGIRKGCGLIMSKQLPDTPWHIGMPKMKESDHRRLNKWCVHYKESICKEPKSGCYMLKCGGSSHCKFYAESIKESAKIEQDNRTQMEIDAENRRKYVESLKPKMQALISSSDGRRFSSVANLRNCYICGSKLLKIGNDRKQCTLCHMEYINQDNLSSDYKATEGDYLYIMGQKGSGKDPNLNDIEKCKFCDRIGRCRDKDAPLFQKRCKPRYCQNLKKQRLRMKEQEEIEFKGVKNIPIDKIVIRKMSPPQRSKLDHAVKSIQENGRVIKPIYVEVYNKKYLLKDGYVRYLAARQCGLTSIPATLECECVEKK